MEEGGYEKFMRRAISLARKARFTTCPNPAVGALLVKSGQIVAEGWHHGAGLPHAEIECLKAAKDSGIDPHGATMVVTLEPCVHYGKTPPCVDALLEAGVSGLVYGTTDPNPEAGGGAQRLKQAGLDVVGPVLEEECRDLISDFIVWQKTERPYMVLKLASTLDGRIATRNGHSRWISNEVSRHSVHCMRADIALSGGAILIGGNTFYTDNPKLTARCEGHAGARQPLACIMTSRLPKTDADYFLLRNRPAETVFFASPASAASTRAEALRKIGCRVFAVGRNQAGKPDFPSMLKLLRNELGCNYVLCEGGGTLALSLLEARLIDEFHLHIAPMILGDNDARPLFMGRSPLSLDDGLRMRFCASEVVAGDARLLLRPKDALTG